MSLLSEYYTNSAPSVIQYDCLEISHSNFTQIHRIVRNAPKGLTVTHEGPAGPFVYDYEPCNITPMGASSDLTQSLGVTLGDLGSIIQAEIAAVTAANGMNERPIVVFRTYRSDDLLVPMSGPSTLEISKVTTSAEGNSFSAQAPLLNNSRTGKLYDKTIFPMLLGFN